MTKHQKTGGVIGLVFDISLNNIQFIKLRRRLTGNGSSTLLAGGKSCCFSITTDINTLYTSEMTVEPLATLGQRLTVRIDTFNSSYSTRLAHQVMVNPQLYFTANFQRRVEQHIQRMIDDSLCRVLHRYHAIIGTPCLNFTKHFIDGTH